MRKVRSFPLILGKQFGSLQNVLEFHSNLIHRGGGVGKKRNPSRRFLPAAKIVSQRTDAQAKVPNPVGILPA